MRPLLVVSFLAFAIAVGSGPETAQAQGTEIPREHHVWGKFGIGSWKQVRIYSEALDATGQVVSTSTIESKTTLSAADDEFYTLTVENTVEVGGKKISVPSQEMRRNYQDIPADRQSTVKVLGTSHVTIEGEKHSCRVYQATASDNIQSTVNNTYYSPDLSPYILYRELMVTNLTDDTKETTTQQVTALAMPHKVQSELRSCSHVKQVHVHSKGRTQTLIVQCMDVPGGTISYTAKELDSDGRLLRRSTLELVDYRVVPFVRSGAWGEVSNWPWDPMLAGPPNRGRFFYRTHSLRHRLQMRRGAFAAPDFAEPPSFTGPGFSASVELGPSQVPPGFPSPGRFSGQISVPPFSAPAIATPPFSTGTYWMSPPTDNSPQY